ncbi:DNA polymerase III alpha subunit, partial [Candidatus Magnetoovum chiemensis]
MYHSDYVPLHVHTQYSLLDGAIRVDELVQKSKEYKMPAVAITDHGNMCGAVEFYNKASKAGLKPIIGCEVYLSEGSYTDKTKNKYYHLILLTKDKKGYKNLVSLVSKAYTEGFYYKPRIDKELLEKHSEGLIALSACLKGEVPYYLMNDSYDKAKEAALTYQNIFGKDNFYLEVQDNGLPEQIEVNRKLVALSKDLDLKIAATNDCHYLRKEDSAAHEILICIQTGKTINDTDRLKFNTDELYFKSPEEMKRAFAEIPQAILSTREIAEKCNFTFDKHQNLLPLYSVKDGMTPEEYMEELAYKGLMRKISPSPEDKYIERFKTELSIIKKMGFSSYFLIVWDFINYARSQNIPVGPGRGSAAGSLVAYCLDITEIDPLKYNLLFERFLNPERISMPDIDVDFCKDRRGEVITYTAQKYGKDHVAQIITFGTMAAKAAIRDVGRALGMPYAEVDKIAKLIP